MSFTNEMRRDAYSERQRAGQTGDFTDRAGRAHCGTCSGFISYHGASCTFCSKNPDAVRSITGEWGDSYWEPEVDEEAIAKALSWAEETRATLDTARARFSELEANLTPADKIRLHDIFKETRATRMACMIAAAICIAIAGAIAAATNIGVLLIPGVILGTAIYAFGERQTGATDAKAAGTGVYVAWEAHKHLLDVRQIADAACVEYERISGEGY